MRPASHRPPLRGDYMSLAAIAELLQAAFDAHTTNVDDALELLQLTEYIQAEIHARHGDELHALLLGDADADGPGCELPF
jgi:hypothetical protein